MIGGPAHLPVLRLGRSYKSLDTFEVKDHRTHEVKAVVSTINAGIIRKDLAKIEREKTHVESKLANPAFRDRAPHEVVRAARDQRYTLELRQEKLQAMLRELGA